MLPVGNPFEKHFVIAVREITFASVARDSSINRMTYKMLLIRINWGNGMF